MRHDGVGKESDIIRFFKGWLKKARGFARLPVRGTISHKVIHTCFFPLTHFRGLFMPTTKVFLRGSVLVLAALPAFGLAACGDLVPTPYDGVPYTHERTAGRGVAYVRASMLPPKETKTEAIMEEKTVVTAPAEVETAPPPPPPPPITAGDQVFDNKQTK